MGHGISLLSQNPITVAAPPRSLANVGDVKNIGLTTLAVGSPDYSVVGCVNCGAISFLTLNSDGSLHASSFVRDGSGALPPLSTNEFMGASVAPVGDYNGATVPDLVVGAPGYGSSGSFLLLLLNGSADIVSAVRYTENSLGLPPLGLSLIHI